MNERGRGGGGREGSASSHTSESVTHLGKDVWLPTESQQCIHAPLWGGGVGGRGGGGLTFLLNPLLLRHHGQPPQNYSSL